MRVVTTLVSAACVAWNASPVAACPLASGQKIVLASQELDPDVFVWDTRAHLVSYVQGDYSVALVLKHTILVRAYTGAVVLSCKNVALHADVAATENPPSFLVGIKVTAGSFRGRFGWVAASDVRHLDGSAVSTKRGR